MKQLCTAEWMKTHNFTFVLLKKLGKELPQSLHETIADLFSYHKVEGVCHADELNYLWKFFWNPVLKPGSLEEVSVKRFVKLWTNFARYGNPTPHDTEKFITVKWEPVDEKLTHLDIDKKLRVKTKPDEERMKFWDKFFK